MDERRKQAYMFLVCSALLHLKWDLRSASGRTSLWHPVQNWRALKSLYKAWSRAFTFHNLAIFLMMDMQGFDEARFWEDVRHFQERYPEPESYDYRAIFALKCAGHSVGPYGPKPEQIQIWKDWGEGER